MGQSSTHRSVQLLFRGLLLQSLLLEGLLCGGGWRQILWAEAEALQKLKNSAVLFLELCNQVTLCTDFIGKLKIKTKPELILEPGNKCFKHGYLRFPRSQPAGAASALPVSSS